MIYVSECGHAQNMNTMGDRLKEARIAAGFKNRREAADRFALPYTTLAAHENNQNEMNVDAARTYAKAFGVDPSWLLLGEASKIQSQSSTVSEPTRGSVDAPIAGWVQAGVWQEPEDDYMDHENVEFRTVARSKRWPNAPHILFEVRGDSFNKVAPDGSLVTCIPFAETGLLLPLNGDLIIAEESDHPLDDTSIPYGPVRRTLKRVRDVGPGEKWLDPESTNPKHKPLRLDRHTRAYALVIAVTSFYER